MKKGADYFGAIPGRLVQVTTLSDASGANHRGAIPRSHRVRGLDLALRASFLGGRADSGPFELIEALSSCSRR